MNITFYNNQSDPRCLSKSLQQISSAVISFKTDSSTNLVSPNISLSASYVPNKANYCYIPNLKRYYYIRSISSLPGKLALLSLEVDPLMSFADTIKTLSIIADRSTSNGYSEILDSTIKTESHKKLFHLNMGSNGVFRNDGTYKYILVTGG